MNHPIILIIFLSSLVPTTLVMCACVVSGASRGGGYQFNEESLDIQSSLQDISNVVVTSSTLGGLVQEQRISHALDLAA
ncbi:hypothetical protein KFU94_08910 [Chloroflexi bacterium TSY]|nr:hypothetical protein [Chloroflexi bacterium TSY]